MIYLRIAEYNLQTGKFERFLELGSDYGSFFYCGDCVGIWDKSSEIKNGAHYFQDVKDPLNRFDGLFDGMTYGNGRFVLIIEGNIDDVYAKVFYDGDENSECDADLYTDPEFYKRQ
jgi:hypothetical protein